MADFCGVVLEVEVTLQRGDRRLSPRIRNLRRRDRGRYKRRRRRNGRRRKRVVKLVITVVSILVEEAGYRGSDEYLCKAMVRMVVSKIVSFRYPSHHIE
jgi:hypothetical protein